MWNIWPFGSTINLCLIGLIALVTLSLSSRLFGDYSRTVRGIAWIVQALFWGAVLWLVAEHLGYRL
jgi:hypothetical protein